jgi:hypothetical protein
MGRYCILVSPSANRVYAKDSVRLMQSEIRVFNDAVLGGKIHELAETSMGGVPYISLTATEFTSEDVAFLSNLSSLHALFEIEGELLRPILIQPLDKFGSDLVSIQKYSGKTNEHFTKLLLNVTAVSTATAGKFLDGALKILDPVCGRGTTLNQSMMYGFDVAGIDVDAKDFAAYSTFIQTWLKNSRIKHKADLSTVTRNRERLGRRLDIGVGITKEQYKAGDTVNLSFVNGDTLRCAEFYQPGSFDVVVADTPYGVQHGSHQKELSRSPLQLLQQAIPAWTQLIRPGGALGLSWNTYVARREDLTQILLSNGLEVLDSAGFDGFRHRVDQAINRDLIVARKA